MKMYRNVVMVLGLALLLSGCKAPGANNAAKPAGNANTPASLTDPSRSGKADFSTPETAVKTLILGATNRDPEILSQCFDAESAAEFKIFSDKTATQEDLDGLAGRIEGGQIGKVESKGDQATVAVSSKGGKVTVTVKKTPAGWKILRF